MLKVEKRPSAHITKIKKNNGALLLTSERGTLCLMPVTDSVVRVMYKKTEEITYDLPQYFCFKRQEVRFDVEERDGKICLLTSSLCVCVDKITSSIAYYDAKGNLLLKEKPCDSKTLEEFTSTKMVVDENVQVKEVNTADGIKRVVTGATTVPDKTLYKTRMHLCFADDEALYGLGQHEEGTFNYRGTTQYLHQANMKIAIPLLVSNKGWGILLTGGSPAVFNDTAYGSYIYTQADIQMDFFFIGGGGDMHGVIKGYRYLTGKVAMLPRWAFGYVQSQERYETQKEILDIAAEYKKRGIGLDLIVLDWDSWVPGMWGQKTFDLSRFPSVKEMTQTLKNSNVHFMVSIWPNMNEDSENYKEFADEKLLLPASDVYDALNPKARELYWRQANEGLFCHGIDSWWCDSNEPVTPEWTHMEKPEPGEMYHEFYETSSKHLPAELCNAYGIYHTFTMYNGQRSVTDEKRVCILTRNGYTGQQAYGSILWSGDISATWQTLQNQVPAGLNMSLSGIPFWTLDSGAFFVKKGEKWFWNGDYDGGNDDFGYRELAVRWMQYATFLPIMRGHGTDVRREFYCLGDKGTMFYDALVACNRLRYKLAPYIYSACGNMRIDDDILMKPLVYVFPNDDRVANIGDQFMLSDSILVCPVTMPMYYGVNSQELKVVPKERKVYLPKGADWYDYYTNERYAGGTEIMAAAPIERIPVFVRSGSVVPCSTNENALSMGEAINTELQFNIYSGGDFTYSYYEDSGDGYGYENGEYRITKMHWCDSEKRLDICEVLGEADVASELKYKVNIIG